ncbi:MAG: hypothetical protein LBF22_14040 [Deltaproteobacteria bacterium]|nr:hypothetical protein [Deltaproteobacteria bacterium]
MDISLNNKLSLPEITQETYQTIVSYPLFCIGISAIPPTLLTLGDIFFGSSIWNSVVTLIGACAHPACYGAIAVGVKDIANEKTPNVLQALIKGFTSIPSFILIGFIFIFLGSFILLIFVALTQFITAFGLKYTMILPIVFLIILSLILITHWCLCIQVITVEGLGPLASLQRSKELTKDNRSKILFFFLIVYFIVSLVFLLFFFYFGKSDLSLNSFLQFQDQEMVFQVFTFIVGIPTNCFLSVALALIYRYFHSLEESRKVEKLADVLV